MQTMGIRFQCPACGAKLNVKAELSGKRGACPKCQAKIQIPAESSDAPVAAASVAVESAASVGGAPTIVAPSPQSPAVEAFREPERPASEAKWFVRPPSGGQYGPAAASVLRQWIDEGRITPDTLVWREGDADWQPASAAFSQLTSRPAPAPATERPALSAITMVGFPTVPIPTDVSELDAAGTATAMLLARRKRARSTGLLVMGILIVAVLVLLPILIIVLTNQGQAPPASEQSWHPQNTPFNAVAWRIA